MSSIKKVIRNLENELKTRIKQSEWYRESFNSCEKDIIELKYTINELKEMEKTYHDHSRCL